MNFLDTCPFSMLGVGRCNTFVMQCSAQALDILSHKLMNGLCLCSKRSCPTINIYLRSNLSALEFRVACIVHPCRTQEGVNYMDFFSTFFGSI